MINVIIPAAGVGTRLRPHTHTAPKALLPVAGQPILGHILERLSGLKGLGTIRIVVGFLGDQIEEFVNNQFDLPVRFVKQDDLLGLGYAVHLALVDTPDDHPVLVILGDTILDVDLAEFVTGPDDAIGVGESPLEPRGGRPLRYPVDGTFSALSGRRGCQVPDDGRGDSNHRCVAAYGRTRQPHARGAGGGLV
jgi:choline kinase